MEILYSRFEVQSLCVTVRVIVMARVTSGLARINFVGINSWLSPILPADNLIVSFVSAFTIRRRIFTTSTVSINPSRIINLIQFDDHVDRFIETIFCARDFYAADYLELLVFRYVVQNQEGRRCAVLHLSSSGIATA